MNIFSRLICAVVALMSTGFAVSHATDGHELIAQVGNGTVNWTTGVLSAVGIGVPPEIHHQSQQGKTLAFRSAIADAQKKLLSAAAVIQIDHTTTVGTLIAFNSGIADEIKEMIKDAKVVQQEYSTDGSVTVNMQLSMKGGFAQLVLPAKIKQIESIKPVKQTGSALASGEAEGVTISEKNNACGYKITGLVVDARELAFRPCLVPTIEDESGQEVFGPAYASREFAVQNNMIGYSMSIEAAIENPRVGKCPLIAKGLKTEGNTPTNVVVSNADAAKLRHAFENLTILRQCRVIIVTDAQDTEKERVERERHPG